MKPARRAGLGTKRCARRSIRHCVLLVLLLALTSLQLYHYYVVRHGEKLNQTDDSPLNEAGFRRAEVLADTLSDNNLSRIFVSDKQRTQQTAAPTAAVFNLDPIIVPKTETDQLIAQLKEVTGKNVLVVRHSEK